MQFLKMTKSIQKITLERHISKQHLQPSSIVAKFSPFGEKKITAQKPSGDSAGQGFLGKKAGGWNIHTTLGRSTFSLVPILSGMTGVYLDEGSKQSDIVVGGRNPKQPPVGCIQKL